MRSAVRCAESAIYALRIYIHQGNMNCIHPPLVLTPCSCMPASILYKMDLLLFFFKFAPDRKHFFYRVYVKYGEI